MALDAAQADRRSGLQLVGLRVMLVLASSFPALLFSLQASYDLSRKPYYTDGAASGRLPLAHLLRLLDDLPAGLLVAFGISALLFLLADQVLNAGALRWLMPKEAPSDEAPSNGAQGRTVWRTIIDSGLEPLWAFLRIQLSMFVLLLLGVMALNAAAVTLQRHGHLAGWSGQTLLLLLPIAKAAALIFWAALVGAWGFWCRLLTVADRRQLVRRTGLLCLSLWWRFPGRAPLLFVGATTATSLLSGALLLVWRQYGALWLLWLLLWLAALTASASVWYWLLRSGCRLCQRAELVSVRAAPDAPLHPLEAIRQLFA